MGDTPSRPAAAPAGAPTVGGTSLEAALAEIEGDRARAANMPPPGVSGAPEIELREVESDEAMARRLQSEEDARGNAAPPAATPAYYPKMPYAVPQPFAPVPVAYPAPTAGRGLTSDVNSGNGAPFVARPVPHGAYRGGAGAVYPPHAPSSFSSGNGGSETAPTTEYARPVPYGFQAGFAPPHLAPAEDDAALARRLQAEEDAVARAARVGTRTGNRRETDPSSNDTSVLSDDAALAKRLQEEEDAAAAAAATSSSFGASSRPPFFRNAPSSSSTLCPGCASAISPFASHVRTAFGKWHRACFACAGCGGAIADGSHAMKDGRPFHVRCYRDRFHPRCTVCFEKIPFEGQDRYSGGHGDMTSSGVVKWISHPYWCDATYCPRHERDGTRKCDGCERMETTDAGSTGASFAELPDGRALCLECASTAVVDTERDSTPVYDDVCQFMAELGLPLVKGGVTGIVAGSGGFDDTFARENGNASDGNLLWRHRPPLHLVSQDALDAADGKEAWHVGRTSRTRGLCLFTEHVIRAVERVPRWDAGFAGGLIPVGFAERTVGAPRRGETTVNAVVVLYGLPFIAFGAILAHECTHAYIRIAGGFPRLAPKVEEGLCQLVALLWVEDVAARGRAPNGGAKDGGAKDGGATTNGVSNGSNGDGWEERNLAAMAGYVANQIRTDPSETYGNGLRVALGAYRNVGLTAVFEHVRATGEIPT
jgi:hypothetical protein